MNQETLINIALVDDHTLFRKALMKLIDSFGMFRVIIESATGEDFLQKCRSAIIKPQVCIIDINMQGMNGFEITEAVIREFPDMKVLAVSMHDNEFSILKMIRSGAGGYLLKNCEPDELKTALISIYQTGFYHSELVSNRLIIQMQNKRHDAWISITDKEMDFLKYNCSDRSMKDIAAIMKVSPRTVDGYRDALCTKLNIESRTGLAIFATKIGIIPFYED